MASTLLANKFAPEGLTYDDVLLVPAYSEVLLSCSAGLAIFLLRKYRANN